MRLTTCSDRIGKGLHRALVLLSVLSLEVGAHSMAAAQSSVRQVPRIRYAPRGLPKRRVGAGIRGPHVVAVAVLAPKDHRPETGMSAPALYWELSADALPGLERVTFTLTEVRHGASAPALSRQLPLPTRPGLQRLALDSLGVTLAAGREYLWQLRVDQAGGITGQDAALIRRRPAGGADRADRGNALVRARAASADARWYDAFAALADSALVDSTGALAAIRDRYRSDTLTPR